MLTMKDVIREGHPNLYKVSEPVQLPLSEEDKTFSIMLNILLMKIWLKMMILDLRLESLHLK